MNLVAIGRLPGGATNLADQAAAGSSFGRTTLGSAVSLGELTTVLVARDVGVVGLLSTTVKGSCLLYTSPSPRDYAASRMPSSA